MNHQRCFIIYQPRNTPQETHVARWPGATELQEADLLGTIRKFFLEDATAGGAIQSDPPFVSGAASEKGSKVLGEVLKSAGVLREVLDDYAQQFGTKNPDAAVPAEGYEWLGGQEYGGPKDG